MRESIEFLILDTIKKHSSIMPLFTAGKMEKYVMMKWNKEH